MAVSLKVLNLDTLKTRSEAFDNKLLADESGEKSVAYVIKWQMANRRGMASASTKTIAETRGSTRKIRQQKGSGGARHGGIRRNLFKGGPKAHGPKLRDFSYKMPKKIVKKALAFILRQKINEGKLLLIEGMEKLKISTKDLNKKLKDNKISSALVAHKEVYENFLKSLRNIKGFKSLSSDALNVYDILRYDFLLLDVKALEKLTEVLK